MEHIIIVRIESDRNATELVSEIQSNLEYEGVNSDVVAASDTIREAIASAETKGGNQNDSRA